MQISAAGQRQPPRIPSPSPSLYRSPCLSLIFMEPKRSHGPLKSRVIELWDHRKCLQFISIMPLGSELQANRLLAAYLFSQVNRLSLFYVQFFNFFFAFLCGNLSTTFHASQLDPTCSIFSRLFLCFFWPERIWHATWPHWSLGWLPPCLPAPTPSPLPYCLSCLAEVRLKINC